MFDNFFGTKLKDMPTFLDREVVYSISLNNKSFKFELQAKESNPLGERYQEIIGSRLWINLDAKASTDFDTNENPFEQKIFIIKKKGDVLDRYEIHPRSYEVLKEKIVNLGDSYDNPDWFITFDDIKEKELLSFTIARLKALEIPEKEGDIVFFKPNEELLLQLADFSNIKFEKVKPWTNDQREKINEALKKLYLKDEDIAKIKEWTLLDLLEKGKVKPKSETCGLILYGPAGTGKTVTVNESLKYIFKDVLGFKFVDIPIGNLVGGENSGIVGGFAKTLAGVYTKAFNYISINRKPYVIFIDEGDDLIEDVSDKDDNGSTWLHQGQIILKNYMNPKRYPGVIFIISTNLSEPGKFYEPFRDQRLGVVHFPIPNYDRFLALFKDVTFSGSLQNKLLLGVSGRTLSEDEVIELAHVCSSKMTLRIVANCCERYNKAKILNSSTFNFIDFKNYLIDYSISETNISRNKDLSSSEKKGDKRKYEEFVQYYSLLLKELALLKRGVSADDDRVLRARSDANRNVDLKTQYLEISDILNHLVRIYTEDSTKIIVNDEEHFLKPLRDLIDKIKLFKSTYIHDLEINDKNKKYLDEVLPILIKLIVKISNKNDVQGDFTKFFQIVSHLPDSTVLFNSRHESRIILGS